jgi:hypothetical protein
MKEYNLSVKDSEVPYEQAIDPSVNEEEDEEPGYFELVGELLQN